LISLDAKQKQASEEMAQEIQIAKRKGSSSAEMWGNSTEEITLILASDVKEAKRKGSFIRKSSEEEMPFNGEEESLKRYSLPKAKPERKTNECFLIALVKSIWAFKGGLCIMGVAICWTFTSALEKYILYGSDIPAPFFLGVQRAVMSIPCMAYCMTQRPKFIDHTYLSFTPLFFGALVESLTVILYFLALEYIYVSYVIAIKRAGNIFLSVLIGRYYFDEPLTKLIMASAGCMIAGVLCIVFG